MSKEEGGEGPLMKMMVIRLSWKEVVNVNPQDLTQDGDAVGRGFVEEAFLPPGFVIGRGS